MWRYINTLTLNELQAITWKYSCGSVGTSRQNELAINPLSYKRRGALEDHIQNVITLVRVDSGVLEGYVRTWNVAKGTATEDLATLLRDGRQHAEAPVVSAPVVSAQPVPASLPIAASVSLPVPSSVHTLAPVVPMAVSAANSSSTAIFSSSIPSPPVPSSTIIAPLVSVIPASTSTTVLPRKVNGVSELESWTPKAEGLPLRLWFDKANALAILHNWSEKDKLNIMTVKITGIDAQNFVSMIKKTYGVSLTWDSFVKLMKDRYELDTDEQQLQMDVGNTKQKIVYGEDIATFSERFNKAAEKCKEMNEATKNTYFLSNISKTISRKIERSKRENASLAQLIAEALRVEKGETDEVKENNAIIQQQRMINEQQAFNTVNNYYGGHQRYGTSPSPSASSSLVSSPWKTDRRDNSYKRQRENNNLNQYRNVRSHVGYSDSSAARVSSMSPSSIQSSNNSGAARDLSTIRCYNCGKTGHYSNRCLVPRRPNDSSRNNSGSNSSVRSSGGNSSNVNGSGVRQPL